MTETEKIVAKFVNGLGGGRYREIFDLLQANNRHPLEKSNTATLLFQQRVHAHEVNDVLAFRLGPPAVMSFPKSYWLQRKQGLSSHLSHFSFSEKPAICGPVSDSQYSAGQIELGKSTHERVIDVCNRICESLDRKSD